MKFSLKKSLLFFAVIAVSVSFFASCVSEDHWINWKTLNDDYYTQVLRDSTSFTKTESGVLYKFLRKGNPSDRQPGIYSYIVGTYNGKFFNDSTFSTGTKLDIGQLANYSDGFIEVLKKMHTGDKVEMFIPSSQGYSSDGGYFMSDSTYSYVPPYSTMHFVFTLDDSYGY